MSIHRIFQVLNLEYRESSTIKRLFERLGEDFSISIVSLNWDIVAEKHLRSGIDYGIEVLPLDDSFVKPDGRLLLKLHGSSNWIYCDCCHRIYGGAEKSALLRKAFLEASDFMLFGGPEIDDEELGAICGGRKCDHCGNTMAGRVATFSYRKAFSINQFQTIWDRAHDVLSSANTWLFVGYSMPEADFEFRHLLKSAQLGRRDLSQWDCRVVVKSGGVAARRYSSFFGLKPDHIFCKGLKLWTQDHLETFCDERGAR